MKAVRCPVVSAPNRGVPGALSGQMDPQRWRTVEHNRPYWRTPQCGGPSLPCGCPDGLMAPGTPRASPEFSPP